jgi:uncharacterized heparinase superfamily protein
MNHEHDCACADIWNDKQLPRLWLYNLHYFDYLHDPVFDTEDHKHILLERWISENPPAKGVGWEPYTLSRRIVNWVKWHLQGQQLSKAAQLSLAVQVRFLRRRLEYHLLANHLLANAKALITAGMFFKGVEADEWRNRGLRVWRSEIREQILEDGGQYERSPMYHAVVLEDVLDLVNFSNAYGLERRLREELERNALSMERWLRCMTHPDGEIGLFNDAAMGEAPMYRDLCAYAGRLGMTIREPEIEELNRKVVHLAASGYARLQAGDIVLLANIGEMGPDFQPGHAHADTLSFELSVGQDRVIVDSGTSSYDKSAERLRQRGTAAHNTVCIDGKDSSDVWSSHRVGRRARIHRPCVSDTGGVLCASGAHDGYRHLRGVGMHARTWQCDERKITIQDHVGGNGNHDVHVSFLLHPRVRVERVSTERFDLRSAGGVKLRFDLHPLLNWQIESATWHPQFGCAERCTRLVGRYRGALPFVAENQISLCH